MGTVLGANWTRWTLDVSWLFQLGSLRTRSFAADYSVAAQVRASQLELGDGLRSAMKRVLPQRAFPRPEASALFGRAPMHGNARLDGGVHDGGCTQSSAPPAGEHQVARSEFAAADRSVDVSVPNFDAIVSEHGPYVWRVLRRLGVRTGDIDDVWQETFIVVHRKLDSFEGRAQLRTWLSAIAVRVASDYRSRAYRRREQATDELPEGPAEQSGHNSQHDQLVEQQRRALLDRLIAELKPEQREVIVLYEFAELPMQEVAEALGCPLQTAYSRLHAARKALESAARREAARKGFV